MIKLEIWEQISPLESKRVSNTEWRNAEAKQMAAFRMRWLRPGGNHGPRWARTTDQDGRVRTFGQVPEGQEAPSGHYVVRQVNADGTDGEIVKSFSSITSRNRAEDWRLDHPLRGNTEKV